jgi:N-acetylmuramoyl-L-alanine amidase
MLQSPNFNERLLPLHYVLLHYTGMRDMAAARARLIDPQSEVSAHYLIGEKGDIVPLVDEQYRAWHAGRGSWHGITDMNSASIGIELQNPGHEFGYRPFPTKQIAALTELLSDMTARHSIPSENIIGHSDYAPTRKADPGEKFPWLELNKHGFGFYPTVLPPPIQLSMADVQKALRAIGYDVPTSENFDQETRLVLLAFQRHWHPENLTGTPHPETCRRLIAVQEGLAKR